MLFRPVISAIVLAKKLVNNQYGYIVPIRCIAHHINLLTNDICKLEFAQSTLKKCMKLVNFFKASHRANATLTNEIIENMVKGGGLKGYCQTRWTTAFDCISSVLKCEDALKNVSFNYLLFIIIKILNLSVFFLFLDCK